MDGMYVENAACPHYKKRKRLPRGGADVFGVMVGIEMYVEESHRRRDEEIPPLSGGTPLPLLPLCEKVP